MSSGYILLMVLVALLPFAGSIFLLSRYSIWQRSLPSWRKKLWLTGMIVVTGFSLTLIFGLSLNFFRGSVTDYALAAIGYWVIAGAMVVPVATILIAFGVGSLRWLGLLSAVAVAACLCFELKAIALGLIGI